MNKFKALGLKSDLCTKVTDIGRVGITKCTGVLHLHFGREVSNTIIYKQPRWELCGMIPESQEARAGTRHKSGYHFAKDRNHISLRRAKLSH